MGTYQLGASGGAIGDVERPQTESLVRNLKRRPNGQGCQVILSVNELFRHNDLAIRYDGITHRSLSEVQNKLPSESGRVKIIQYNRQFRHHAWTRDARYLNSTFTSYPTGLGRGIDNYAGPKTERNWADGSHLSILYQHHYPAINGSDIHYYPLVTEMTATLTMRFSI